MSFCQWGAPSSSLEPGPLPRGWDDGAGDAPAGTGAAYARQANSGPIQRISCSHIKRAHSAHTAPPATEIGTPIQKPQPAQLTSHHDISNPNSVTAAISTSEPDVEKRCQLRA